MAEDIRFLTDNQKWLIVWCVTAWMVGWFVGMLAVIITCQNRF